MLFSDNQNLIADTQMAWCRGVVSEVKREGFAFCKELSPQLSTLDVARRLGSIVDIERVLPGSGIPDVQPLVPKTKDHAPKNRYSGHYGVGAFPLHTDLAHWSIPPRYVLLRCLLGSKEVETKLLAATGVIDKLGESLLQKAILRVRRHGHGSSGLLRALLRFQEQSLFRWDSIFLEPVNDHAEKLKRTMEDSMFDSTVNICLEDYGDTLLLDNWKLLHGRSAVPPGCARQVERVYLFEVNGK